MTEFISTGWHLVRSYSFSQGSYTLLARIFKQLQDKNKYQLLDPCGEWRHAPSRLYGEYMNCAALERLTTIYQTTWRKFMIIALVTIQNAKMVIIFKNIQNAFVKNFQFITLLNVCGEIAWHNTRKSYCRFLHRVTILRGYIQSSLILVNEIGLIRL